MIQYPKIKSVLSEILPGLLHCHDFLFIHIPMMHHFSCQAMQESHHFLQFSRTIWLCYKTGNHIDNPISKNFCLFLKLFSGQLKTLGQVS